MCDSAPYTAAQDGSLQYPDRTNVRPDSLAGAVIDQRCAPSTLPGSPVQLGAPGSWVRRSTRTPFTFGSPAGDSDLEQRTQRRRRANRESARRVCEKRAQQCGALETQAAEAENANKHLLRKLAQAQGENSLATGLLHAFHLKVAHLQGLNESLQVKVANMQQDIDAQVGEQVDTAGLGPTLGWQASHAATNTLPPASEPLKNTSHLGCCRPLPALSLAQQSQAQALSPFATAAPTTPQFQAAPLPWSANPPWEADLALNHSSQTAADFTGVTGAGDTDAMLGTLTSEQSAPRMQRYSSLSLSRGLSAMVDAFFQPQP